MLFIKFSTVEVNRDCKTWQNIKEYFQLSRLPSRARVLNLFRLYQCFTEEESVNNYSRKSKGSGNLKPKKPVPSHPDLQTSLKTNFSSIGNSRNVSSSNSPIKSKNIHRLAEKSCNAEKNIKPNELSEKHSHISCKEEKPVT